VDWRGFVGEGEVFILWGVGGVGWGGWDVGLGGGTFLVGFFPQSPGQGRVLFFAVEGCGRDFWVEGIWVFDSPSSYTPSACCFLGVFVGLGSGGWEESWWLSRGGGCW